VQSQQALPLLQQPQAVAKPRRARVSPNCQQICQVHSSQFLWHALPCCCPLERCPEMTTLRLTLSTCTCLCCCKEDAEYF
jgi:hypothetical protein